MTVEFVALGPAEVEAALLLSEGESVHVRARPEDAPALRAAGFAEGPVAIESFVRAPLRPEAYPRRYRKQLRRSLDEWARAGLAIELVPVADFGLERFVGEVYKTLFVRAMYGRGIAPHFANRLDAALELAGGGASLALVRDGAGALAGAALLRPARRDPFCHLLSGALPEGGCDEGLVYALRDELAPCRKAFMAELAGAVARRGGRWLSLGRDLAWCEEAYAGVMFEKAHLADGVAAWVGRERDMYRWRPRGAERFIFFEWDREAARLVPHNFGCAAERFEPIAARLADPDRKGFVA